MAARDDLKITAQRRSHTTKNSQTNVPDVLGLRKLPVNASKEQGQFVSLLASPLLLKQHDRWTLSLCLWSVPLYQISAPICGVRMWPMTTGMEQAGGMGNGWSPRHVNL